MKLCKDFNTERSSVEKKIVQSFHFEEKLHADKWDYHWRIFTLAPITSNGPLLTLLLCSLVRERGHGHDVVILLVPSLPHSRFFVCLSKGYEMITSSFFMRFGWNHDGMRSKCRGLVTIFEATSTEEPAGKFFVYQQPTITGDTAAYLGLVLIILAPVFLKVKSTAHSLTVSKTLCNSTAARLRAAEWRKNVARDCAFRSCSTPLPHSSVLLREVSTTHRVT